MLPPLAGNLPETGFYGGQAGFRQGNNEYMNKIFIIS
jgi:hypothetical protein